MRKTACFAWWTWKKVGSNEEEEEEEEERSWGDIPKCFFPAFPFSFLHFVFLLLLSFLLFLFFLCCLSFNLPDYPLQGPLCSTASRFLSEKRQIKCQTLSGRQFTHYYIIRSRRLSVPPSLPVEALPEMRKANRKNNIRHRWMRYEITHLNYLRDIYPPPPL